MSQLDTIKSESKAKRILKGIHFQFDGAHIALTEASQGGACSLMNDPLLLKSQSNKKLTKEQEALLTKLGKDISTLEKSGENTTHSSSSLEGIDGEDTTKLEKENQTIMSDAQTNDRIAKLEKALAVSNAVNALMKYNFEDTQEIAVALSTLEKENLDVVTKAFDKLQEDAAKVQKDLDKALEDGKPSEDSELAKKLEKEQGHEEEAEIDSAPLTLVEKAKKYQEQNKEAK